MILTVPLTDLGLPGVVMAKLNEAISCGVIEAVDLGRAG